MSRVIMFSQVFPKGHPQEGKPTFFKEKIWAALADAQYPNFKIPDHCTEWDWLEYYNGVPKWHTIRAGNRWKVGDKFSPRVWSGKPYASKQIVIADDIELKKVWSFEMHGITEQENGFGIYCIINEKTQNFPAGIEKNDGLKQKDFHDWFNIKEGKPFIGQILCWNDKINY
jgi:hypothetical protein